MFRSQQQSEIRDTHDKNLDFEEILGSFSVSDVI